MPKLNTSTSEDHRTSLSMVRTALANQRTYLSYIRTAFVVFAAAVALRSVVVASVGMILLVICVYQYYKIAYEIQLEEPRLPNKDLPLIFVLAVLMSVYYFWNSKFDFRL